VKSRRQRAHPQGTNARNRIIGTPAQGVAREVAPDLSREARRRLSMLDWHRAHGGNVSLTARHFGVGRSTVYRWLERFDRFHLETLEDRRSTPQRRRRPTWTVDHLRAVKAVRERYPRWGKDKLVVILRRAGVRLSTSMVGRILTRLRAAGDLREPARRRMSVRARRWPRPYAVRRPVDWAVDRPGDLVELDTLDVRPVPGRIWKQFTARDLISRWDTVELGRQATARAAADVLDRLAERMPFPIRAISIDNGSEFIPRVRGSLSGPGDPLVRPAAPLTQAPWHGRARQPDPPRGVLRGDRRRTHPDRVPGRPARLGDGLQHDPSSPGPGLPDPGRIPGLRRGRCVTDVPDEYTGLT
jgi:transposase